MPVTDITFLPPLVVFWSGEIAEFRDNWNVVKDGIPHERILMTLDDKTIEKYDLRDEVNQNEGKGYPVNSIVREYPKPYITKRSPVLWIMFCNFDAVAIIETEIQEKADEVKRILKDNSNLRKEADSLREQMKEMADRIKELEPLGDRS